MSLVPTPVGTTDLEPAPLSTTALAAAFLLGYEGATRAAYGRDLRAWLCWCDDHHVDPLAAQRAHVDTFARTLAEVEYQPGKTRSPATVARHLCTLAGFYRYAVGEDLITRNPVADVRRPRVGTDTLSTGLDRDEFAALIEAAREDGPRPLALVLLLGFNGLRISEALGADVEDLGTERGHRVLRIRRKGGKTATVPMAPPTADAVGAYLGDRARGPIFVTATGKRWQRSEVWRTLRRLASGAVPEKAGTLHPHDYADVRVMPMSASTSCSPVVSVLKLSA